MLEPIGKLLRIAGSLLQGVKDGLSISSARSLGGRFAELPSETAAYWLVADRVFPGEYTGREDAWFGDGAFEVQPEHISLLRRMRFTWEGAERGAPMLAADRPYGQADLVAQLGQAFPGDDAAAIARRHVGMTYVLMRALRHGALPPGDYRFENITPDDVRHAMAGYADLQGDTDLGLNADGSITITDEHLRLLREITVRWPPESECEERLAMAQYPAATCDCKRPYGDCTFIEVDMARILDRLPQAPADGIFDPAPDLARHLQRLHWQMLPAIQAFVEHAAFAPGTYTLDQRLS